MTTAVVTDRIVVADLDHPAVVALLELHMRAAHENSPPGHVFAVDLDGLRAPDVTVWAAWDGGTLLGLGALKVLGDGHGEIKSMRTAPAALRRGVGRCMLRYIIDQAREQGYTRLSLETGNNDPFDAARAMYGRAGFVPCAPFADYDDLSFSAYYTLAL